MQQLHLVFIPKTSQITVILTMPLKVIAERENSRLINFWWLLLQVGGLRILIIQLMYLADVLEVRIAAERKQWSLFLWKNMENQLLFHRHFHRLFTLHISAVKFLSYHSILC